MSPIVLHPNRRQYNIKMCSPCKNITVNRVKRSLQGPEQLFLLYWNITFFYYDLKRLFKAKKQDLMKHNLRILISTFFKVLPE